MHINSYTKKLFINVNYVKNAAQTCDSFDLLQIEREGLKKENERLQNVLSESIVWVRFLEGENSNLQNLVNNYQNLLKNVQLFKKATGLEKESFDILLEFLDPGENSCKLKHDNAKEIAQKALSSSETPSRDTLQERGPRPNRSRYIITWTNFLYLSLGSIPIWPSRQQIKESIPETFKQTSKYSVHH